MPSFTSPLRLVAKSCVLVLLLSLMNPSACFSLPDGFSGLILLGQWGGDPVEVSEDFQADILYARDGIVGENEVTSPWVASSTALLRWIGFRDYFDLIENIENAYELLDPSSLESQLDLKTDVLLQQEDDWVGWIDASLLARATNQPDRATLCLENAIQCPTCVDSPGLRVLKGISYLESSNLPAAHIEYASAIAMAADTGDPSFLFRMRQIYADDLYDRGHLEEAIEKAYVCMESEYPIEKAWAYAMEIVYLWSRDDLDGVQSSVTALSGILPDATPQAGSAWERNRFGQTQFIRSIAEAALSGDPLSKMTLDVEATDFHYKKGEFQRAVDRLSPWVTAYPTASHDTFSEEEQDWSLWAKYNYLTLCASLGGEATAENGFREIVETVPYQDNPKHVVMSWCSLAQALTLQERTDEAQTAFEMGLDLDANDVEVIPEGVLNEREQPRILGGKMPPEVRAAFVHAYRRVNSAPNSEGGEN